MYLLCPNSQDKQKLNEESTDAQSANIIVSLILKNKRYTECPSVVFSGFLSMEDKN